MANSYVYILKCNDGSYYVGSTKDVGLRFWEHSNGEGCDYTAERIPVHLIYVEIFTRIDYAFGREHQIKRWSRKKKEALITGEIQDLQKFSKKKFKVKNSE
ncbi:GIY-YIG nuclease family protein [Aequorivita sp. H23M31]|uniref:GIY-YIG nuclease family protein n=1 Tax=Aequorivita ciconiae TaxID=2494375 RepID=A0A410G5E1_9FLAO|nr:GIY-YIG nuclease family protein [Aequorivita sp. H23M31]QAA82479.1 GIY-YIG nuclease family protein [Aequorivita sp. H23M31]